MQLGLPAAPQPENLRAKMMSARRPKIVSFLTLNARSLFNKIEELHTVIKTFNPVFISVQETWCTPKEPDSLYRIPNYTLHRRDRQDRPGGGVCIYVNDELVSAACRRTDLESSNEDLWIKLTITALSSPLMVCTSYRPPNSAISQYARELEKSVATVKQMQCSMIITGDMNGHHSQWYANDQTDNEGEHLHQLFTTYGLDQLVTFPTHIHQNTLRGCIDLVFTDL